MKGSDYYFVQCAANRKGTSLRRFDTYRSTSMRNLMVAVVRTGSTLYNSYGAEFFSELFDLDTQGN